MIVQIIIIIIIIIVIVIVLAMIPPLTPRPSDLERRVDHHPERNLKRFPPGLAA